MNLSEIALKKSFSNEDACIAYLESVRWPDGIACPQCANRSISSFQATGKSGKTRQLYQCLDKACRYQFSPTTGTIFHDSHLPLSKWFHAIGLLSDPAKPISVNQLRQVLGVQYKTAAHIAGRIREAVEKGSIECEAASTAKHAAPVLRQAALSSGRRSAHPQISARPSAHRDSATGLQHGRREPAFLGEFGGESADSSGTAVDNMLSMFVSLAQMTVRPPLFFVNYLKDKVFT